MAHSVEILDCLAVLGLRTDMAGKIVGLHTHVKLYMGTM